MSSELGKPDIILAGRFETAQEKRYAHVPFEVPRGVSQLHMRYSYSDQIDSDPLLVGGNTLDIGVFDERGIAPGSPGFRGWSGSERMAFTIDRDWATLPYAAGPIGAGTWHIQLGPYKVAPQGMDWRVEVFFDAAIPREEKTIVREGPPRRPALPPAAEPGWVRGDLHCHTVYSDGDSWPSEILLAAADAGLDFLGATDHNNAAHHAEYGAGGGDLPIVIPGVEVTTYRGHWNAWGVRRWFEFREPDGTAVEASMREAADCGALVSVCHPKPFGPPWEYPSARGYQAIEVWNGPWERLNADALRFWEAHLRRGERIVAVGGSDTHNLRAPHHARLGAPTTWVNAGASATPDSVLQAIRHGDVFLSASPRGPQLYLSAERVRVLGASGASCALVSDTGVAEAWAIDADDWRRPVAPPRDARYVRAQVMDGSGAMLALSNASWLAR